jgi:hypothetical protein
MCNLKWNVILCNMIEGIHLLNLLSENSFEGVHPKRTTC